MAKFLLILGAGLTAFFIVIILSGIVLALTFGATPTQSKNQTDGYSISLSSSGLELNPGSSSPAAQPSSPGANQMNQDPEPNQENKSSKELELEQKATSSFNSMLREGQVTIARVDKCIQSVDQIANQVSENLKVSMVQLQLQDMKGQLLSSSGQRDEKWEQSVIEAAKIAKRMYQMDGFPMDLRFSFSQYVYKEAIVFANQSNLEACIESLSKAVDMGYAEIGNVKTSADFSEFHSNPQFVTTVTELELKSKLKIQATAQAQLEQFDSYRFEFALESISGQPITDSDFHGQLLLVDFWGTWCPPCVKELPTLDSIRANNQEDTLKVLCFTYERNGTNEEQIERVQKLFRRKNVALEFLLIDAKLATNLPNFKGYPTKLLIDAAGKVRMQWTGPVSENRLQAAIDLLVKE